MKPQHLQALLVEAVGFRASTQPTNFTGGQESNISVRFEKAGSCPPDWLSNYQSIGNRYGWIVVKDLGE